MTSRVQKLRKNEGLEITDRIELSLATDVPSLSAAIDGHRGWLMSETLAEALTLTALSSAREGAELWDIEGFELRASLRRMSSEG